MDSPLVLPPDVHLKYLNEGAANIVYHISFPISRREWDTGLPSSSKIEYPVEKFENSCYLIHPNLDSDKLLRLRKNLPTTLPVYISQLKWTNCISPLFQPNEIVQQSMVSLRASGIISRLNQELEEWERSLNFPGYGIRVQSRHGTYLADEDFGLLVTDMTPTHDTSMLVEFKPKWLVQSLSAPSNSIRCRQCAHNAHVNAKLKMSGQKISNFQQFCPLDLLSEDQEVVTQLAYTFLSPEADQVRVKRFVHWMQNFTLLRRLKKYQMEFDRTGVLNADPMDEKFLIAMTLRDCTLFLRMSNECDNIEARLGDLDLKSASKILRWKKTELELINGGWYEGTEDKTYRQPNICVLARNKLNNIS